MNRLALRTELQATGFGTAAAEVTRQNEWLKAAYTWVWNAARWSFRYVDLANLTVTSGDATPTMPGDFGRSLGVFDQYGDPLRQLDPDEFDRRYQEGVAAGETGSPEAYKVTNRIITLGPTPNVTATFKHSYERRVSHFESDGTTVTSGFMDEDDDLPLWPDDHHLILVHHAAMIGHGGNRNDVAVYCQQLRDSALEAMEADLAIRVAPGRTWPRYRP